MNQLIGKGSFSRVVQCYDIKDDRPVSVKLLHTTVVTLTVTDKTNLSILIAFGLGRAVLDRLICTALIE